MKDTEVWRSVKSIHHRKSFYRGFAGSSKNWIVMRVELRGKLWYDFCMLLGYGPPNLHVSSSALTCRFQCSWSWNVQIRGPIPNRPRREPYFLSSHMLYLTSQRTKPGDLKCFEVFIINKDHRKNNGAKRSSDWRDMQINVPFPLESTHPGYRCTTCAFIPVILYAGRLV